MSSFVEKAREMYAACSTQRAARIFGIAWIVLILFTVFATTGFLCQNRNQNVDDAFRRMEGRAHRNSIPLAFTSSGIAFTFSKRRFENSYTSLHHINSQGTDIEHLTRGEREAHLHYDYYPASSPEGDRVVYATSRYWDAWSGGIRADCRRNFDLEIISLNESGRIRLTDECSHEYSPSWSASGKRIAFAKYDESIFNWAIFTMDNEGKDLQSVTTSEKVTKIEKDSQDTPILYLTYSLTAGPIWSPNEQQLVFVVRETGTLAPSESPWESIDRDVLYIVNKDGTGLSRVFAGELHGRVLGNPAWSPSGKELAIVYATPSSPSGN